MVAAACEVGPTHEAGDGAAVVGVGQPTADALRVVRGWGGLLGRRVDVEGLAVPVEAAGHRVTARGWHDGQRVTPSSVSSWRVC